MGSKKRAREISARMRVSEIYMINITPECCDLTKTRTGIWTQLALAYAIHKSFIFLRVPLTAAVTPKVVKVLRGWGWDTGKRKPKGVAGVKKD